MLRAFQSLIELGNPKEMADTVTVMKNRSLLDDAANRFVPRM
jgi:hypothetical protein